MIESERALDAKVAEGLHVSPKVQEILDSPETRYLDED